MSAIPEKISKYEVLGVAGKGAMGQVYLGHDPFVDRRVAIKVCVEGDESAAVLTRKMFLNEAQAAGALDHPNVLRVYDADEAEGRLFIVMEYIEGGNSLKRYCRAGKLLPVETVVNYMEQCANGLDYAHSRNVLHRDIKPENILLTVDGQAKIADFGIAQRLKMDVTVAHGVFGSPLYMSPEQLDGRELTGLTDLYSLGVSMFELLAGRPPFTADTVSQLIGKIATEPPPSILEFRPALPEAIAAVVMKAIQKPLEMRFQSGKEMAEALEQARRGEWGDAGEIDEGQLNEVARTLSFFEDFSDGELEQVLDSATWHRFTARQPLITEGQKNRDLFVLATGEASVRITGHRVGSLSAGECAGELAFLADDGRSASVVAEQDLWALKIEEPLSDWASMPVQLRFARTFEKVLVRRLRRTSRDLVQATS